MRPSSSRAASRSATRCPSFASQSTGKGAHPPPSSGTSESPSCQARSTASTEARAGPADGVPGRRVFAVFVGQDELDVQRVAFDANAGSSGAVRTS